MSDPLRNRVQDFQTDERLARLSTLDYVNADEGCGRQRPDSPSVSQLHQARPTKLRPERLDYVSTLKAILLKPSYLDKLV